MAKHQHRGRRTPLVLLLFLLLCKACSARSITPGNDGAANDDASTSPDGADSGTSCSGLMVPGPPVQLLDHPPASGNLYTSLVSAGTEHLFLWRIFAGDGVYMRRVDASGQAVGDDVRLRPYESAFDVAWSDGAARLGAVWTTKEEAGGAPSIMFQPFDQLGNALTEAATIRSSTDINIDGSVVSGPRIASVGDEFVVVWAELTRIFVARLDREGQVQGAPVLVAESDTHPTLSIAAGTNGVLVGWTRGLASPPSTVPSQPGMSMVTRAFSSALVPRGPATVQGQDPSFIGGHQVLSTQASYVALWDFGFPPDTLVQIARLDDAGAQIGSNAMGAPVTGPYRTGSPTVWDRNQLVVLWNRAGIGETGLTLSRFTATGQRQGASLEIPTGPGTNRLYLTEHDGTFAFIWSEEGEDRRYRVYFQRAVSCD